MIEINRALDNGPPYIIKQTPYGWFYLSDRNGINVTRIPGNPGAVFVAQGHLLLPLLTRLQGETSA